MGELNNLPGKIDLINIETFYCMLHYVASMPLFSLEESVNLEALEDNLANTFYFTTYRMKVSMVINTFL